MNPIDKLNRPLQDLRISITDKCNFRCRYCMPREVFGTDHPFLPKDQLLSFEEITRVVRIFSGLGVKKIRLTGGEPLMRRDVEVLISQIAALPGLEITLTTNGSFPLERVRQLKQAGLDRITVSLDSLDNAVFQAMSDVKIPVSQVLTWINECEEAGFSSVKVNMVVQRGVNKASILPMAKFFKKPGTILRFIEYMDVGNTNGWRLDDVVPAREIISLINAEMPIEPISPNYPGEVAKRWRYKDGTGEIGMIASVSQPFCSTCTRGRLSAEGKLFTCLFAVDGFDLRDLLRSESDDSVVSKAVSGIWQRRTDRYSEIRTDKTTDLPKIEMSYIGG